MNTVRKVGHQFEWLNCKWDVALSHKGRMLYKRGAYWFYAVPGYRKAFDTFEDASRFIDHVNNCYGG